MADLLAADGLRLSYADLGPADASRGEPLVCLAGGPMQDAAYLGDLGGLARTRRLIRLDLRGTGQSETPADPASYRCDRLVRDVEALREHLGLHRISLLGHSAGANLAVHYAEQHPERVEALVLITPSTYAVGLEVTSDQRRAIVEQRRGEPWFPVAAAAFEAIQQGNAQDADWAAITPFTYGRWDAAARRHDASAVQNETAAVVYGSEGAFDPDRTRAALARLTSRVLLLAGEVDVAAPPQVVGAFAELFAHSTLVTQSGAGHFPWLDDSGAFCEAIAAFLD